MKLPAIAYLRRLGFYCKIYHYYFSFYVFIFKNIGYKLVANRIFILWGCGSNLQSLAK